ncbi:MAG TPA: hypothetical protein VG841_01115 [Caulobacterales bacterium]|nr:hypothetical protein [Caulobacterales bacterium]
MTARGLLVLIALALPAACAIDHPGDDPGRDECSRYEHGRVTPNC